MTLGDNNSADRIRLRQDRLLTLRSRVQQQINDADCLIETIEDYCRQNPDDCPCAANDPSWQQQIINQREGLAAMLLAIREKISEHSAKK